MPGDFDMTAFSTRLNRRNPLDREAMAALNKLPFIPRNYEPGQYLLREGDKPKICSVLVSGFVYRHKIVGDGGRQIVSVHLPHDFVDLQNMLIAVADHNIQALTSASVLSIDSDVLTNLCLSYPQIAIALWQESLIEASILREWIANVGRRDARSRTAHMLCELAIRREVAGLGKRGTFELPMTQEQLGDTLGLTAVHVNRTLKTLESDGLITRNKRSVTVADWGGLQGAGDFTTAYLHLPDQINR